MADPQRPAGPVPAGPPGYVIRPPQDTTPPPAAAVPPPTATTTAAPIADAPAFGGNLTQNGAIIGVAITLGLTVVIFLLRGAVRSHLIANRSSLSQANSAAWALFAFLLAITFTVVFGLLGQFWTVLSFIIPLGLVCLVTLVLFIVLYQSATRISR
jgi:hypothetical protein